jgi:hypothetical protein
LKRDDHPQNARVLLANVEETQLIF